VAANDVGKRLERPRRIAVKAVVVKHCDLPRDNMQ
jgi:hypothetical protein